MSYINEFYLLFILNLINLVSPGAGCAITIKHSVSYGRAVGIMTGLGIVLSSFIHKAYGLLGFSVIFTKFPQIFWAVKILGVSYLLYLAFGCFKNAYNYKKRKHVTYTEEGIAGKKDSMTKREGFVKGFLTDLLNPAASLGFMSIVVSTLSPETSGYLLLVYLLILISCSLVWYVILALFFSQETMQAMLLKLGNWLETITGSVFVFLAFRLMLSGIK